MSQSGMFGKLRYRREGSGLEFDRVSFFTDAVFAIALTIIAVGIEAPELEEPASSTELLEQLDVLAPKVFVFFMAFLIIGKYWVANHHFVRTLQSVDDRYMSWTLVYLALVAFLPFPASLMGSYPENPVAVSAFAVAIASICLFETMLIVTAQRDGLFFVSMTKEGYRWTVIGSLSPVVIFGISILVIVYINTYLGMLCWLLTMPTGFLLDRFQPDQIELDAASESGQTTS